MNAVEVIKPVLPQETFSFFIKNSIALKETWGVKSTSFVQLVRTLMCAHKCMPSEEYLMGLC